MKAKKNGTEEEEEEEEEEEDRVQMGPVSLMLSRDWHVSSTKKRPVWRCDRAAAVYVLVYEYLCAPRVNKGSNKSKSRGEEVCDSATFFFWCICVS